MRCYLAICMLLIFSACASTPRTPQELATKRFEKCMDETLPSFGPVQIATANQRLKAAEVCKSVMAQGVQP